MKATIEKIAIPISYLLLVLAIIAGLGWWLALFRQGAPSELFSEDMRIYIAFGVVQVLGWLLIALLLHRVRRTESPLRGSPVLILASGMFFANLLYFVTPVGAALALMVSLFTLAFLLVPIRQGAT
jgi:hypothetical protein